MAQTMLWLAALCLALCACETPDSLGDGTIDAPEWQEEISGDDATVGPIDPTFCVSQTNGTPCDDGNGCTVDDSCLAGQCTGGTNKVCDAQDPCQEGACDALTGECAYSPAPDGTSCDVACYEEATCQSGKCEADATTMVEGHP